MKHVLTLFLYFLVIIFIQSCQNENPLPPEEQPLIILSKNDASCIEAWLNIRVQNVNLPVSIELYEKDSLIQSITSLYSIDTAICIESLLPKQNYDFRCILTYHNQYYKSDSVSVTTMDTTSHDYTWESWTFGDIGSSSFSDCAIISENDIWCVGKIMLRDTSENGYSIYNAVHWDGNEWTIKKIMFGDYCGSIYQNATAASAIQVFPNSEILIAKRGAQVAKLVNGVQVKIMCTPPGIIISTMWGQSVDDFYVAGEEGEISHHKNGIWTRLNSGTVNNINAMWGDINSVTGKLEVLAAAGNINHGSEPDREILKIINNSVEKLNPEDAKWPLSGIWFKSGQKYIVTGVGVFTKDNRIPYHYRLEESLTQLYIKEICGDFLNNIWAVGDYGEILHFNGTSWRSFINETYMYGTYSGVDVKDKIIVSVGNINSTAIVTIGKAND